MRVLLFVFIIMISLPTHAQQEWVDYIVGRPAMYHIEAKKAVAKEWGIAYTTEMAGCIDCENTRLRAAELDKKNQAYFKQLEYKYGEHWLYQFNKEVAKEQNYRRAQDHPQEGTWYEFSPIRGDSEYYSIKKKVAAEWGIPYAVIFTDNIGVLDPVEKRQLQEAAESSNNYLEQLQSRLGIQLEWIEQESQLRLLQKTAPEKGVWTDVVWGMPNSSYYEAKAAVAKEWGINYQPLFIGSERTPDLVNKQRDLLRQNAVYFASLHQHFPATWLEAFYREVQQAYYKKIQQ